MINNSSVFSDLLTKITSEDELNHFIEFHIDDFYDFVDQSNYDSLNTIRFEIEHLFNKNWRILSLVSLASNNAKTFYILWLEILMRYNLFDAFNRIYSFLNRNSVDIPLYLRCVRYFCLGTDSFSNLKLGFDKFWIDYAKSYSAGDNSKKLCEVFISFYNFIIETHADYNLNAVREFASHFKDCFHKSDFYYKEHIVRLLDIPVLNGMSNFDIQSFHDRIFENIKYEVDLIQNVFYIEAGSPYAYDLDQGLVNFQRIKEISTDIKSNLLDSDLVYNSLDRGVAILNTYDQLAIYMHSFGRMHYMKLKEAFSNLSNRYIQDDFTLIDWGCGQGIGSIVFSEMYNEFTPKCITLIEPSEKALRRASLNISKLFAGVEISTICSDFDRLIFRDIINVDRGKQHIHIFSNVLDMDSFCIKQLSDNIKSTFFGDNLFVCISPFINEIRKNRLGIFMNSFSDLEIIYEVEAKSGGWINNWTKVIRIFRVKI